ncbi:hypothetical protein ERHA55_52990 (plasmid) [Erwinia rhapontici]|nr:hypothetical protein ERHA55_52990 [Erwinia rhapontici]
MKKTLTLLAAATLGALSLSAWADTLTVGASNVPHAEILEQAKPILAKQGIDLEIKPSRTTFCRTLRWPAGISMLTISSISLT